jgi:hypothetical protein
MSFLTPVAERLLKGILGLENSRGKRKDEFFFPLTSGLVQWFSLEHYVTDPTMRLSPVGL